MSKRRWSQFLRARRLAISYELQSARNEVFQKLVEEIVLNDEFEATIDRRGRRTEKFMLARYEAWINSHRDPHWSDRPLERP